MCLLVGSDFLDSFLFGDSSANVPVCILLVGSTNPTVFGMDDCETLIHNIPMYHALPRCELENENVLRFIYFH